MKKKNQMLLSFTSYHQKKKNEQDGDIFGRFAVSK
jgi:hypothetical protein